ncbi:MAG: hypothetical protein KY410_08225 [Proteobacteria bacterium]|nr:hypothetical protein [Pseudomonadota bacterium]
MDARFRDDPNFNLLLEAAAALEELREQLGEAEDMLALIEDKWVAGKK